jgi:tRNA G26 N,N-dimethylase Trm1
MTHSYISNQLQRVLHAYLLCRLLASVYLQEDYFDLVDVDSFGSDTSYLPAAIDALKFGGMLYLTSTDGISAGGEPDCAPRPAATAV